MAIFRDRRALQMTPASRSRSGSPPARRRGLGWHTGPSSAESSRQSSRSQSRSRSRSPPRSQPYDCFYPGFSDMSGPGRHHVLSRVSSQDLYPFSLCNGEPSGAAYEPADVLANGGSSNNALYVLLAAVFGFFIALFVAVVLFLIVGDQRGWF